MKKIGLALGGGGARGLAHIKAVEILDELKIKPSIISGTSMGAIIGGFYASGTSAQQMLDLIDQISLRKMQKLIDFSLFASSSLLKGKGIEEFLKENIAAETFDDLEIPLKVVATDYWQMEQVVFSSGDLVHAIRASMSIPAIFEPVEDHNRILIDGGAVNPVPHDIIRQECDYLIAVDVMGEPKKGHPVKIPNIFDSIMTTFQIMQRSIIDLKKDDCQIDCLVSPDLNQIGILDFHKEEEVFNSIKDTMKAFKDQLEKDLL